MEFYNWKTVVVFPLFMLLQSTCMMIINELFFEGLSLKDVRFVVISQPNSYHKKRSLEFKKHFEDQIMHLPKVCLWMQFTYNFLKDFKITTF